MCGEVGGVALLDVRRVGGQGVVVQGNWIVHVEKLQFMEVSTGQG